MLVMLSGCTLLDVREEKEPPPPPEPKKEELPIRETKNVTYTGIVKPAGISIYQQGSHRLTLPGGKFILLESATLDLNGYVDEEVHVFGALRPTVEAGGMIMRVERIELLEEESSSSQSASDQTSSSIQAEADIVDTERMEDGEEPAEPKEPEAPEEVFIPQTGSQERIDAMAAQDFSAPHWTQSYCTSHIGFCAPVHRNWWFKSFGATGDALWHVEISSEPLEKLSDGPIVIDLLSGSKADDDNLVDVQNGIALGYREWTFGRHFRIRADESLVEAVRYITQNIEEYGQ